MNVTVYYWRRSGRPLLRSRSFKQTTEHYYIPSRGIQLIRLRGYMPMVIAPHDGTLWDRLETKKFTRNSPKSSWEVWELEGDLADYEYLKRPKTFRTLKIEKKKIDGTMFAYREYRDGFDSLSRDLERLRKFFPKVESGHFTPTVNPFDLQEEFFRVCERVFP